MKDNICIRECKKSDIPLVYDLWKKLAQNECERDVCVESNAWHLLPYDDMKSHFYNCFNNKDNFWIFVAEYKGKLLGYSELWYCKKDNFSNLKEYAHVNNLFIDKNVKINKNPLYVFYKLLKSCENKAKEKGCKYISGDVFEFNNEMKALLKLYHVDAYKSRYIKRLI